MTGGQFLNNLKQNKVFIVSDEVVSFGLMSSLFHTPNLEEDIAILRIGEPRRRSVCRFCCSEWELDGVLPLNRDQNLKYESSAELDVGILREIRLVDLNLNL